MNILSQGVPEYMKTAVKVIFNSIGKERILICNLQELNQNFKFGFNCSQTKERIYLIEYIMLKYVLKVRNI